MSAPYYTTGYSLPVTVANKGQYPSYPAYSMSPPECEDSVSSISGVPSYSHNGFTNGTPSYMGAPSVDYETTRSASGVDFQDYMQDRFSHSFNPIPLDRSMAVQAQA